jgi:hypothetical protein
MQQEFTSNGVRYKWDLAGPDGAGFVIYKDNHTEEEVKKAIKEIRNQRDVVTLRRASPEEVVEQFLKDVVEIAMQKGLTFFQVRYDAKDLLMSIGVVSAEEYVKKNFKKWNKNIPFKL